MDGRTADRRNEEHPPTTVFRRIEYIRGADVYDFQSVVERRGTTSIKWHMIEDDMGVGSEDVIAMSVADMEFKPAPEIVEALVEAAQHDIFGYDYATDGYFRALTAWMSRRHNWDIDPAWVSLSDGVMPAVNTALRAVTHPGDKVILQGPVYYPFTAAAEHNGLTILDNRLILGDDGRYVMDSMIWRPRRPTRGARR